MADVDALFAALDAIAAGGEGSSAVVEVGADGHYAEFRAVADGGMRAEVVGNRRLADAHDLSPAREDLLRARDWALGADGNWARTWPDASTPRDRRQIALEALSALDDVHGASGEVRVATTLARPAPAAPAQRRAILVGVIAALVALAGAVAAALAAGGL